VGRLGAAVSAVKVGMSTRGKYPPPIEVTEPLRETSGCDMGETSRCEGKDVCCEYPVGADGRFGGGGETFDAEKAGEGCADVLGADSTYG
jgi:hypothetical protein